MLIKVLESTLRSLPFRLAHVVLWRGSLETESRVDLYAVQQRSTAPATDNAQHQPLAAVRVGSDRTPRAVVSTVLYSSGVQQPWRPQPTSNALMKPTGLPSRPQRPPRP